MTARPGATLRLGRTASLVLALFTSHGLLSGRPLASDEEVMFFPATARFLSAGSVELRVEAWVYEKEDRPGVTTAFRHYLGVDPDSLGVGENEEFRRRVRLFLTDSEGDKHVALTITTPLVDPAHALELPETPANGRTSALLVVPAPADRAARWIDFEARGPEATFTGRALLVPEEGLSVVSDIDDTIRHTHVLDRREMLLNTFVRPLAAVPGMAGLYTRTETAAGASTRFHYVSGGPHQLWPMLDAFVRDHGFPEGSMHLRTIDWRAEVFGEGTDTVAHKLAIIRGLMRDFPRRRFVLVGDSGEKDPEIYGTIAREFPAQVAAVRIRDVTGDPSAAPRYVEAFRDVPAATWSLFTDPASLDLAGVVTPPPPTTLRPAG